MPPELVSDLVSDENSLLPECFINAGVWCREVLDRILTRCAEVCSRISTWCQEKISKYEREITIVFKSISIIMYIMDLGTDLFTSIKYFSYQKPLAGYVTIIFSVLPMLFLSFKLIMHTSLDSHNNKNVKFLPIFSAVLCSPILPLGWMVLDLVVSINVNDSDSNNDNNNTIGEAIKCTAAKATRLVKLFVAIVESFPQSTIQLFIVFRSLAAEESIELWQWACIAVSLISLSLSVSTGYLNAEAGASSKIIYFLFGLLAVTSRQVVCCVYSIQSSVLWLVPFCAQLATSIIIWSIKSKCKGQWNGLLIFLLTEAYNSFTLSGLLTSSMYFCFAMGAFFLEPKSVSGNLLDKPLLVSAVLASLSLVFNVLFTVIPKCKGIRMDWMKKCNIETIEPDIEGTFTVTTEKKPVAMGAISYVTESQSDTKNKSNHFPETGSIVKDVSIYTTKTDPDVKGVLTYTLQSHIADGAVSSTGKSSPGVIGVVNFASESHQPETRGLTYAIEAQAEYENILNSKKIKPDTRNILIDSTVALEDVAKSLKDVKESQMHNRQARSEKDTQETTVDSEGNLSDIEETHL